MTGTQSEPNRSRNHLEHLPRIPQPTETKISKKESPWTDGAGEKGEEGRQRSSSTP